MVVLAQAHRGILALMRGRRHAKGRWEGQRGDRRDPAMMEHAQTVLCTIHPHENPLGTHGFLAVGTHKPSVSLAQ
jgi:hypothetical protein